MDVDGGSAEDRPTLSVPKAAKLLRKDIRTVRRMVEDGRLQGRVVPGEKQNHWEIYADQEAFLGSPTSSPTDASSQVRRIAALEAHVADLRAELVAKDETIRQLRIARDLEAAATADYRSAIEDMEAGGDALMEALEHFRRSSKTFRASADKRGDLAELHSDVIGQLTTPGHPGALNDPR